MSITWAFCTILKGLIGVKLNTSNQLTDQSISQLIHWIINWWVGQSVSQSVSHSIIQLDWVSHGVHFGYVEHDLRWGGLAIPDQLRARDLMKQKHSVPLPLYFKECLPVCMYLWSHTRKRPITILARSSDLHSSILFSSPTQEMVFTWLLS